jgi:hypothetical protein
MNLSKVIERLEAEIVKQRDNIRYAGDFMAGVYIGEEIGKLQTAILIIKTYKENNEIQ